MLNYRIYEKRRSYEVIDAFIDVNQNKRYSILTSISTEFYKHEKRKPYMMHV